MGGEGRGWEDAVGGVVGWGECEGRGGEYGFGGMRCVGGGRERWVGGVNRVGTM